MKSIIIGLAAFLLAPCAALAQADAPVSTTGDAPVSTSPVAATPGPKACAAAYGALAQEQTTFGNDTLLTERRPNFARIDYNDRLFQLAGKTETGLTELKTSGAEDEAAYYHKLVDAETEGDVDTPDVNLLLDAADACDRQYGFSPSLGG